MFALVAMFMIPKLEIPIQVSLPEQLLKIFPMTGFAPSAVSAKMLLRKNNAIFPASFCSQRFAGFF